MKRLLIAAAAAYIAAAIATPAAAITNGTPDGDAHPYVGTATSGDIFCSGTLLAPRVFLTAGHCTDAFAAFGQPTYVTVDPNAGPNSDYVTGTPHTEPGFFNIAPQRVGVPASVGHDLGVIVLDRAITLPAYGQLPGLHAFDGAQQMAVTAVGYGAQDWTSGPGGRQPVITFVRTRASATLITDTNAIGDEFAVVSTNPGNGRGGVGPGDSGAPDLLDGTRIVTAVGSHVAYPTSGGTSYCSRLDTLDALDFITPFLAGS
jgi:hypothetical protein